MKFLIQSFERSSFKSAFLAANVQHHVSLEKAATKTTPISPSSGWKLVSRPDLLVFYRGQTGIEPWRNSENYIKTNVDSALNIGVKEGLVVVGLIPGNLSPTSEQNRPKFWVDRAIYRLKLMQKCRQDEGKSQKLQDYISFRNDVRNVASSQYENMVS